MFNKLKKLFGMNDGPPPQPAIMQGTGGGNAACGSGGVSNLGGLGNGVIVNPIPLSSPVSGQMTYDKSTGTMLIWNGTAWVPAGQISGVFVQGGGGGGGSAIGGSMAVAGGGGGGAGVSSVVVSGGSGYAAQWQPQWNIDELEQFLNDPERSELRVFRKWQLIGGDFTDPQIDSRVNELIAMGRLAKMQSK